MRTALALLLLCLAAASWAAVPQQNDAASHKAEPAQRVQQAAPQAALATSKAVEPVPPREYYRPCDESYDQRQSDLCAQWKAADANTRAADWAWWQLIVSGLGLAGLLYTLRLSRITAKAAVEAVEAQVAAERPILQIVKLAVDKVERDGLGEFRLLLGWSLTNQGKTGCWMETMCIYPAGISKDEESLPATWDESFSDKMVAYVEPGRGWGQFPVKEEAKKGELDEEWKFTAEEAEIIEREKRIYVFGYSIYRDPGGRRWKTGFALRVLLTDAFSGAVFNPCNSDALWADERIPSHRKPPWYERWPIATKHFFIRLYNA